MLMLKSTKNIMPVVKKSLLMVQLPNLPNKWYLAYPSTTIQVLKKAGRPSEQLVSHTNCKFEKPMEHECVHVCEITEAAGTEEAEANAKYDNALKEAIRGVQDSVTAINEHMEEVRYEIAALEDD
ncbi:hypothetical protein TIFTF001_050193 [Ficus carica]|uniref:Uncharacterized protein n=1 Tax=Ficus carica TaxID=3494 RepID=A0AA87Z6A6_FICCA|nr:hypothetical protein TIFTF001_050193 [Ficus carica]